MNEDTLDNDYVENVPPNVEFAGFWIRVGAALIDGLIFLPLIFLEMYNKLSLHSLSILFISTILMIIYKPYLEYVRGATIGKSAVGVKVVNEDFEPLTLNQAVIRYIPWFISAVFNLLLSLDYYNADEQAENFMEIGLVTQDSFWNTMSGIYGIVFIVIVVVVAFDKRKQGLHDKLAETYCIKDI